MTIIYKDKEVAIVGRKTVLEDAEAVIFREVAMMLKPEFNSLSLSYLYMPNRER